MPEADRFKGNNFPRFKSLLIAGAKARGVLGYLDGSISKPIGPVPYQPTAATVWYSRNSSEEEWEMRDAYTQAMIITNIDNPVGYGITDSMTAAGAYNALTDIYDKKSDLGLVTAERALRDTLYVDGANFDEFISDARMKWTAVNDQGGSITDTQFRGILLNALPHSWDPVIAGMDSHKTSAEVINRLRLWDARVNAPPAFASTGAANTQALAAQGHGHHGGGQNSALKCANTQCGRTGHLAKDCFRPGGGKEGQWPDWWKGKRTGAPPKTATNVITPVAAAAQVPVASDAHFHAMSDQFDFMALMAVAQEDKPPTMSDSEYTALCKLAATAEVRTFVDSGATHHCFVLRSDFATYTPAVSSGQTANAGASFRILGQGKVYKSVSMNGLNTVLELDAIHTPDFASNLLSVSRLVANGCSVNFSDGIASFTGPALVNGNSGTEFMTAHIHDGMYVAKLLPVTHAVISRARSQSRPVDFETWHRRFGHVGDARLRELIRRGLVDGLDVTSLLVNGACADCIYGKQTRRPFDAIVTHETELLECIHIDLWGKARTVSAGGAVYMMHLMDGASSKCDVFFLKDKKSATTLAAFKEYVTRVERQTGKKVRRVRIDGGGEWEGEWIQWCAEKGIIRAVTPAYTSQNNGAAERGIRTIIEWTCCGLSDTGLPHKYWAEIAATMVYLINDELHPQCAKPQEIPVRALQRC
jgi:hypothetical protein